MEGSSVFYLATIGTAAWDPAAVKINTVIGVSPLAGRAFSTRDLSVRDCSVSKLSWDSVDSRLFCSARRLIPGYYSKGNAQRAAVFSVRIANAGATGDRSCSYVP